MGDTIHISDTTKGTLKLDRVLFARITEAVLGKKYDLSLVFCTKKESQALNAKWRGKDKPTNILSFSLSKTSGEIYICTDVAKKEAPAFEKSLPDFIAQLLIHGCFHLKGMEHGSRMEKAEMKIRTKFRI